MRIAPSYHNGFSLVELSIVLVILGLLTGGILAGQSLIRAAELRSVSTEYSRWSTASQTFRDKYFAIPGDFRDATKFWLRTGTTACDTNSTAATGSPGSCDGNGELAHCYASASTCEIYQFWRQMALAGLIEGNYTGFAGPLNIAYDTVPGTNSPVSKLSSAGWAVIGSVDYYAGAAGGVFTSSQLSNALVIGTKNASNPAYQGGVVLKPEEAWNIDTKLDDGKPAQGMIITNYSALCNNATSATDTAAVYALSATAPGCYLFFTKGIN